MNIYQKINQIIEYIENNLEEEIDYKKIAQLMQMNEYTSQITFLILCDISIADYIRKRRLSNAGYDLYTTDETIMNIAVKYQYTNATAFSRAFEKFHGMKPSAVKKNPHGLKVYSRIHLDEDVEIRTNIEYSVIEKDEIILYGKYIKTDNCKIGKDAPLFWKKEQEKYIDKYGEFNYGMTSYTNKLRQYSNKYWVLYDKEINDKDFKKVIIPKSKWIVFRINSQESKEIQKTTDRFYKEFIISSKYKFREIPELEYYHDNITDLMIPIED